jgi:hypothetical protein
MSHRPYNEAVKEVAEEQLLLNLVRLRYNDDPTRLDVSSIAAQYELDAGAEARPFFGTPNPAGTVFQTFTRILPDITTAAADRPTISLTPLDDPDTIRGVFTPATLDGIVFLAETSYPISTVFRLFIEYMNGVPNAVAASGPPRQIAPEFHEFLRATEILQQLQDSNELRFLREEKITEVSSHLPQSSVTAASLVEAAKSGYEYRQQADGSWALIKKDRRLMLHLKPTAVGRPELQELCALLHLQPGKTAYEVTVANREEPLFDGGRDRESQTINLYPRSLAQASYYLSRGIEVPPEHLACGVVKPAFDPTGEVFDWQQLTAGLFTVHSVKQCRRPACSSVAIKYRGYWYYIDDRDNDSKITFSLVLAMTRVNLLGTKKGGPMLTLPVSAR